MKTKIFFNSRAYSILKSSLMHGFLGNGFSRRSMSDSLHLVYQIVVISEKSSFFLLFEYMIES